MRYVKLGSEAIAASARIMATAWQTRRTKQEEEVVLHVGSFTFT
jgi:hypothetical protein